MTEGDFFNIVDGDLSPGEFHTVKPTLADTNAVEVHSISHGDTIYVYHREDPNFDGSFSSVQIATLNGNGSSRQNKLEIGYNTSKSLYQQIRVYNPTSASYVFMATGIEISN